MKRRISRLTKRHLINKINIHKKNIKLMLFFTVFIPSLGFIALVQNNQPINSGLIDYSRLTTFNTKTAVLADTTNQLSVSMWYAKYGQIMTNIIKYSGLAQTDIKYNQQVNLSLACKYISSNLVSAQQAPPIANSVAQSDWRNSINYYLKAIKLCNQNQSTNNTTPVNQLASVLNYLKLGDKNLFNSIDIIAECC